MWGISSNKWKGVRGINTHPPKTSRWAVKFRNLRRLRTQKLAVRFKISPEAPQKYPESSNKVIICLFSEISAKFSEISGIFRVSIGLRDSLGDLRENAITFYSGLWIWWSWTLWKAYSENYPFQMKLISKINQCKCCDKCFPYVSAWNVRFEHWDISKTINIASLLIVRHYLYSRSITNII
jgi:hypothetical protein